MAPAVAQQTDDETFVVSANRSNRTVAEMAQTTWVIEKRRTGTADSGRQRA
ncbi:Aerobactin siderophore receptor IutA @ TonB-dependent siderophore receptor [Escherichia coli ISC7]|uniref:Aerobactin siderophore receptor IutA @ TonB-dependent siderophore receptor n=1 Tax=Escherichia coli ISC7 TaxID=1432555 RepID=W1F0H1_ECOLX|nr:Aerobactin siderophore receptor IutA @ TonB-dependent siderophore receptor [Escherichia coli ISC7]